MNLIFFNVGRDGVLQFAHVTADQSQGDARGQGTGDGPVGIADNDSAERTSGSSTLPLA